MCYLIHHRDREGGRAVLGFGFWVMSFGFWVLGFLFLV